MNETMICEYLDYKNHECKYGLYKCTEIPHRHNYRCDRWKCLVIEKWVKCIKYETMYEYKILDKELFTL